MNKVTKYEWISYKTKWRYIPWHFVEIRDSVDLDFQMKKNTIRSISIGNSVPADISIKLSRLLISLESNDIHLVQWLENVQPVNWMKEVLNTWLFNNISF